MVLEMSANQTISLSISMRSSTTSSSFSGLIHQTEPLWWLLQLRHSLSGYYRHQGGAITGGLHP